MKTVLRIAVIFLVVFLSVIGCRKNHAANKTEDSSIAAIPYHPLTTAKDLDRLLQQIGNARLVLLGEASHGTSEYYQWRDVITRRMIAEKGFDFVGVEGAWADSYRVNQFIKGPAGDSPAAVKVLRHYDRWPTWMWGNYEVASLITWMNRFNQDKPAGEKAGFFGLDVYCLRESITE